jgi:PEP-CTERM/exosortase A-associated glycosyltransferase
VTVRVLHVLHTSLPHICGYSIRSDYILRFQREHGHEVAMVTSAQQPDEGATFERVSDIDAWRTRALQGRQPPVVREFRLMSSLSRRIDTAIREWRPDLIHAHSPALVGLPALRSAMKAKLPLVYEVRDLWENASVDRGKFKEGSPLYRASQLLESAVFQRARAVVTICEKLRETIAPRVKNALHVVGNGVDTDQFTPRATPDATRARWGVQGKRVIGYIGTFQPYEGLETLIAAVPEIARTVPNVHVVITGSGGEEERLRQAAKDRGVASQVTFTGRVPHAEVLDLYAAADLFVYPRILTRTTALTTPLKPLEAMAMARPVMVSDVGAMLELVKHGETGLVFKAGDSSDLARGAAEILGDPARQRAMGEAARNWVVSERQWPVLIKRYGPIYEAALRG